MESFSTGYIVGYRNLYPITEKLKYPIFFLSNKVRKYERRND
jgi:hypothetical protein